MNKIKYLIAAVAVLLFTFSLVFVACTNKNGGDVLSNDGQEEGEELTAGANGTVFDQSVNAFNDPIPVLTTDESTDFAVGNAFNRNNWVMAPASTTSRDGLGPMLNAQSCSGCHELDGRGRPPLEGEDITSMVFKLSISGTNEYGAPMPLPNYGDQLNNKAILAVKSEGTVKITYTEAPGAYPDGTTYSLRTPSYQFINLNYGDFPADYMFSPRVAPKMTGTGVFDGLEDATILANADPSDADGDGISGKPNYVWDYVKKEKKLGKIGWKAGQASVANQVAHAFLNDIGITSSILPNENLWGIEKTMYDSLPNGGNPEINDTTFGKVVYYNSALAMPSRRNYKTPEAIQGKKLFSQLGCVKCHIPKMQTGTHPLVAQLSNQTVRIYSDLLLHDLGPDLADSRPEFDATGSEWRTAPLWGLGYIKTVNNHTFLLHDGRARGIEEAILWHGGEAYKARENFKNLAKSDRNNLITFLNSL